MTEVFVGLCALVVGGLLSFGGGSNARVVLALFNSFIGFLLGAGVVAASSGEALLSTSAGWAIGAVFAAVLMLLSYSFYELALVTMLAAAGFVLSAVVLAIFGVEWSWVVGLVAAIVGAVVALAAFAYDLPRWLLVVLTSLTGASVFTAGLLLVIGNTSIDGFRTGAISEMVNSSWAWLLTWAVVSLSAIYVAWNSSDSVASRDTWED